MWTSIPVFCWKLLKNCKFSLIVKITNHWVSFVPIFNFHHKIFVSNSNKFVIFYLPLMNAVWAATPWVLVKNLRLIQQLCWHLQNLVQQIWPSPVTSTVRGYTQSPESERKNSFRLVCFISHAQWFEISMKTISLNFKDN